jgi:hypothetical protein
VSRLPSAKGEKKEINFQDFFDRFKEGYIFIRHELRGRVFGVLGFAVTLASVLPMLFAATIADFLGVNVILAAIGLIILAIAFYSRREFYEIYTYHRS